MGNVFSIKSNDWAISADDNSCLVAEESLLLLVRAESDPDVNAALLKNILLVSRIAAAISRSVVVSTGYWSAMCTYSAAIAIA
ncbi:hypothetical protein IWW43_001271 [Coemansia sp. RSA 1935]|nr:hypothetical protein IWW43_001271 [Coemansia sp. RSA 1935]